MSRPDALAPPSARCAAATLLVASDFDGVLAPLVARPDRRPAPLPGTIEALQALAALPGTSRRAWSPAATSTRLTQLTGLDDDERHLDRQPRRRVAAPPARRAGAARPSTSGRPSPR